MRVSRLFPVMAVVLLVGALLPAAVLAAKAPAPSITGSCSVQVQSVSGRQWMLTGTFSYSGQPGGTAAGVTDVQVAHGIYYTGIDLSFVTWTPTPTDRTSGTMTVSAGIAEEIGYVAAGDHAFVSLGFLNKRGVDKSVGFGFDCGYLPPLV